MSERLDPEEVKEITTQIFDEISKIVSKYDGFIEKYAGDAVMALFGVPKAHEDDPIRAVKAAREIHELIYAVSPELENRIGQPISMHTGINTGLVVTGEVNVTRGTHGVAGDTINMASRLSNLAKPGEILIDANTCLQAEGHFTCEYLEETTVKGKADPVQVHKVLSQRDKPITIHRLSGLRADLVGRKAELAELSEAVENLQESRGRIFSICGAAGTGKSRLVEEFKDTLDFEKIQWIEGHAYAYSQNIPYFPLIDLLNRVLHIEENDPSETVREKVESGIEHLVGKQDDIVPYVGSLYSLSYPEVEGVSPEFWKSHLQTIFFLEDLHWADPSFVELLRKACLEIREPAIVLCVYRPIFSLFTGNQLGSIGKYYQEIQLQDLSRSEAQDMLESLLKTFNIPTDLKRLVQSKAGGNPFYLEELVNSLIESETLIRDNGDWRITKSISEADVSSSIHGLITGRLDRLDKETKRILQEASVIGRAFLYEILIKITELKDFIDGGLSRLERLDMIRTRALQPDLEYMFKHPLTQEVVYNGVLKKERQEIHEQIALVMERVFQDRLPEFYETLAFHFKNGQSKLKAVDYLMRSGEKSLKRYALEESNQYYSDAFDILSGKLEKTREEKTMLIDLLFKWAFVFYYLGHFRGLTDLLIDHEDLAKSLDDKSRLARFNAWLGFSLFNRDRVNDSYQYLTEALKIFEEIKDDRSTGYICSWLTWTCGWMGLLDEAIHYGERAQKIYKSAKSDPYIYYKSLMGLAFVYWFKGQIRKVFEAGKKLLDFGYKNSNIRSIFGGHAFIGHSYSLDGDFARAIEGLKKAIQVSADPYYSQVARFQLGLNYISNNQYEAAEEALCDVIKFDKKFGIEIIGTSARIYLGIVLLAKGQMSQGLKILKEGQKVFSENQEMSSYALYEYIVGKIYMQFVEKSAPISLKTMAKNIGFLIKNLPFASRVAEEHFNKAIEIAKEIGAWGILGQTYFDLGLLHKLNKRTKHARECISEAIKIFEECETNLLLKKAKDALVSL
jgi:class 3 adenylate cyclase/tetratricopeptide (TPR) repeat protein